MVCAGIEGPFYLLPLELDGRQVAERRVAAARIVEALDELEDRHARLGLRPEPSPVQQLAFERGEETLRHCIVIGIANRSHRGAHARLTAALAELDGRILRALVGVVDHVFRAPLPECHAQCIEHDLRVQRGGH